MRAAPAPVDIAWSGARPYLAARAVRAAARAALAAGRRSGLALSIAFVTDRELARLHGRWLGDPSPTDVLAFDLSGPEGGAGEIYASWECARRTARSRGVDPARELVLYVVHGALHLAGFDDRAAADRRRMRAAEGRILASLGWPEDPGPHDAVPRPRRAGA